LLCDTERTTATTYDIDDPTDPGYPLRVSFLIGPDRRIIKVYDVTDPAGHAADVLRDLP
jgi:peroxiredoxin